MKLKNYQKQALERFSIWYAKIIEGKALYEAWAEMEWPNGEMPNLNNRFSEMRESIPHVCIKVPTGGGKTLLAVESLVKTNIQTGLVLWVVPTTAIYRQTKSALWNREHPYRQVLERASGGRVKVLEKNDLLTKLDVENYMCVMLISLQSANRRNNKEFLKMFQDSGLYSDFFPEDDDDPGQAQLTARYPTLTKSSAGHLEHTLANVIKLSRPIVILDEAHKAYGTSSDSFEELNLLVSRFEPSFVFEFSATPNRKHSNILIDVPGRALKDEEMIKLPVNVTAYPGQQWQDVLTASSVQRSDLEDKATLLLDKGGKYIRPIALIRVPRTGEKQRGKRYVHAEDVRDYLTKQLGIPDEQVKVHSGTKSELDGEDLMSDENQTRWIITKDALKEGWDCSFAYLLVILDNITAETSLTQMVGRILRQPTAALTGIDELDQCYVHCSSIDVDTAISKVKTGLEAEGLADLSGQINTGSSTLKSDRIKLERRPGFENLPTQLPQVLWNGIEEIDYEKHILAKIDWSAISAPSNWDTLIPDSETESGIVDISADKTGSSLIHNSRQNTISNSTSTSRLDGDIDLAWYSRILSDTIPNPWQAARIVLESIESLCSSLGWEAHQIRQHRGSFIKKMLEASRSQIDGQAEVIFKKLLEDGEITFDMTLPFEYSTHYEILATDGLIMSAQKSLFTPLYEHGINKLEKKYVIYLDNNDAIQWWHRIAAGSPNEYKLQGWKKGNIYPDFVALKQGDTILVHETKGNFLAGTLDTEYKERLLACLQQAFNSSGTINIKGATVTGEFGIIFESAIHTPSLP